MDDLDKFIFAFQHSLWENPASSTNPAPLNMFFECRLLFVEATVSRWVTSWTIVQINSREPTALVTGKSGVHKHWHDKYPALRKASVKIHPRDSREISKGREGAVYYFHVTIYETGAARTSTSTSTPRP